MRAKPVTRTFPLTIDQECVYCGSKLVLYTIGDYKNYRYRGGAYLR